jgi:hypothetical protein
MNQRWILLVVLAGAIMLMPAIAAAQSTPEPPDPPDGDLNTTTAPPDESIVIQLSPATWITDYEYDDGEWSITLKSEMPTTLTVSEAVPMDESGAERFSIRQYDIERGVTTVKFQAPPIDGMSKVSLTTSESIANGNGVYLQSGSRSVSREPVPFNTANIFIGVSALGGAGLAFAFAYRRYEDDEDVDRRDRIA